MAPGRVRSLIAVPLLLASMAVLSPSAARADAGPETFVTMISETGDSIGGGQHRFFHPGNATISLGWSASSVYVSINDANQGVDFFNFEFAAPPGESLEIGEYEHAQRAGFQDATRPGIDITGNHNGCNTITGRFRVKELTRDLTGALTSAWILYEQHCEGHLPGLIGEVRVNVPGDGGNIAIGPREIRWPEADPGSVMQVVPFVIRNTALTNVEIGTSTLSGPSAPEFEVGLDDCQGKTLGPGDTCKVFVGWVAGPAGDKSATLLVPEAGGPTHALALEGYVHPGRTRLFMTSDPGDWIGRGQTWSHAPSNSRFGVGGNYEYAGGGVSTADGTSWSLSFASPSGDTLERGRTYTNATRTPFKGSGAGVEITGGARSCNTLAGEFTINDIFVNAFDELERLSVTFEQHCEGGSPALRGIFEFRATGTLPEPEPEPEPDTIITSGPFDMEPNRDGGFAFSASVGGSTFECSFEGSGFEPCTSPFFYQGLSEGSHTFRVRATSPAGKVDPSPAERTWIIDAFGPVLSVTRPTAGVYVNDQSVGGSGPIAVVGSVTVQATATDAQSGVSTVGFDVNGTPVDPSRITREGDSFRFTFRPPGAGEHTITVRAENGSGLETTTSISVHGVPAG
jgi:hypothetical protein